MTEETRSQLSRAFEDLNAGLLSALALGGGRPELVDELLTRTDSAAPSSRGPRTRPPARPRPRRRPRLLRRAPRARAHLVLVD